MLMVQYWRWTADIKGTMHLPSRVWWWTNKEWGQADGWGQCSVRPSVLWH